MDKLTRAVVGAVKDHAPEIAGQIDRAVYETEGLGAGADISRIRADGFVVRIHEWGTAARNERRFRVYVEEVR